ncbi:MAG: molybdopterin molybdotransferase MoeA, partial [Acidimicrobiia bacterium]|nr:molybdopterin molybdotransferase MoeA [Acidimicrobiia bacterium]
MTVALLPLEEARRRVLAGCPASHPRAVALEEALGCVAAAEIRSEEAVPNADNSAMDGYAVRASDVAAAPVDLRVVGTRLAGSPSSAGVAVGAGEALRIMTGAPMPEGADGVVMVELTSTSADRSTVTVREPVAAGTAVRRAGDDLRPGDLLVAHGTLLTPGRLGVLASVGVRRVPVYCRPVVGVLSTGDELAEGPGPLEPGQVRDSNRPTLLALLRESGFGTVDLG